MVAVPELSLDDIWCAWNMGTNYGDLSRYIPELSQSTPPDQMTFSYAQPDAGTQNIHVNCSNPVTSQNLTKSISEVSLIFVPGPPLFHLLSKPPVPAHFPFLSATGNMPVPPKIKATSSNQFFTSKPLEPPLFHQRFKQSVPAQILAQSTTRTTPVPLQFKSPVPVEFCHSNYKFHAPPDSTPVNHQVHVPSTYGPKLQFQSSFQPSEQPEPSSSQNLTMAVNVIWDNVTLGDLTCPNSTWWNYSISCQLTIVQFGTGACFEWDMGDGDPMVYYQDSYCAADVTATSPTYIQVPSLVTVSLCSILIRSKVVSTIL